MLTYIYIVQIFYLDWNICRVNKLWWYKQKLRIIADSWLSKVLVHLWISSIFAVLSFHSLILYYYSRCAFCLTFFETVCCTNAYESNSHIKCMTHFRYLWHPVIDIWDCTFLRSMTWRCWWYYFFYFTKMQFDMIFIDKEIGQPFMIVIYMNSSLF